MSVKTKIVSFAVVVVLVALGAALFYLSFQQKEKLFDQELQAAQKDIDLGNGKKAVKRLGALVEEFPKSQKISRAKYLLAEANYKADNFDDAKAGFEQYLDTVPEGSSADDAYYYLGRIYLDVDGNRSKARVYLEKIDEDYPDSDKSDLAVLALGMISFQQRRYKEARENLASLLERVQDDENLKNEVEKELGAVNLAIVFSHHVMGDDLFYHVKQGDLLSTIARNHNVTVELLMKCNGLNDPKRLVIDQRLKIPEVEFSMTVDMSTNSLVLYNKGKFFKGYTVRTGKYVGETPVGEFKVLTKSKNPTWNNPRDGKKYPPGDPNNELGTRWMAFKGSALGIHGTIYPDTVGLYASNGCVGMYKEDVEELFDLVIVGTPLKIVGEQTPEIIEQSVQYQ